jgi:hypothetical protein
VVVERDQPAVVPHKFVNSGTGRLRQTDIHANDRFVTEWLEGWQAVAAAFEAAHIIGST